MEAMLQRASIKTSDNADIERELYQLGLQDSPPSAARDIGTQTLSWRHNNFFRNLSQHNYQIYNRNIDRYYFDSVTGRGSGVRSRSAPATSFERQFSYPGEFGTNRQRGTSIDTRSLNDIEPSRPRSSSHGSSTTQNQIRGFKPIFRAAPVSTVWQDPGGVHYPGYVQVQDFLTLPRGGVEIGEDDVLTTEEEAEQQLVASLEAALRKVHAGIQESYIHYDHPDSVAEPPPPQPVGTTLSDPPPSPEPLHYQLNLPKPHNGMSGDPPTQKPSSGKVYRTLSEPFQYEPGIESVLGTIHTQPPDSHRQTFGALGPPLLIDANNASRLSRQLGFIPIQGPKLMQQMSSVRPQYAHHHSHHRHHTHRSLATTVTTQSHHDHHMYHDKKKTSKAQRMIKDVAAITRGSGIKKMKIRKIAPPGPGFGFSIKGSLERGVGVYVSRVEENGPAWKAGLRTGDLLLAANNHPVSQMSHMEIITLLKSSEEISLTVAATSQISTPAIVTQSYSWVTPDSRPTSPPVEFNPRLHRRQVQSVVVNVGGSDPGLGLMIRGGAEYSLGIYITGVDRGSAAENAGLQVGDQILEVNGESFLAVTHDTAVSLLKYSRHLEMSIRRIAKVPHSCTTYHRRRSTKTRKRASSEEEVNSSLGAILTMIEEKSKSVLSFTEHSLLHGTVTEYAAGRVPVSKILIVAEKVLNSPDKLSLLTELREVVRLADLNEFDATVFNRSSSLSIEKSRFLNEDLSSPGEIDSINKLVHCLQLNTGEILTNSDENHFEDLPKCLDKNVKNREENKKRKGVTRQKERKRYKKLPKNDNSMKNNSILAGDDLALLRNSSVKLKSSMNTRKFLKKRLSEKSLIRKEDIDANEQETLPSRRRHSLSGDENRFRYLSDTQLPQMFSDHLQEHLSLPQFSDSDLPGVVTSQPSYFSRHSLSDAAIHQTSYNHHHSHRSLTPNGKLSHLTSFSPLHLKGLSSSPIFSPTFLESDGSSPQFSQVNHSSKFQLSLFSQDIPENGLLHSDHFSGHLPRIPPSYLSFEQRGKYSPDPFSEDQSDIVHSHLEPYYMTRHLIDDRNDCNEPQFYPSRVQQEFRHVYTSASIRDPNEMSVHQAQRRFKNAAAQTGEIIEFDEIFDSGIVDNHRRSKDMQFLMKDSYTRDIYHNHFPFWDQNFDNLERSQLSYQLSKSRQVSESSENSCYLPRRFPPHHMLSHSRRRAPPLVDGHGRFHVKVRKTKASLGIAIEGGSNTKHPLPRVINISTDGAAFEAANLRVGQLILESNGKKLSGKTHEEVARIIAECWTDKSKRELDLLVNDKGQTDTDIRSSHTRLSKAP